MFQDNENYGWFQNLLRHRLDGNQIIKFGQLIEYNMRNIFLEKSYINCNGKASPRSFYKKSKYRNMTISLDQQPEMLLSLLLMYVQVEVYQDILKLRC